MILGDFRADVPFVTNKELKTIRIRSDTNFHWLIADDVDTTAVTTTEHTYDRQSLFFSELTTSSLLLVI